MLREETKGVDIFPCSLPVTPALIFAFAFSLASANTLRMRLTKEKRLVMRKKVAGPVWLTVYTTHFVSILPSISGTPINFPLSPTFFSSLH